MKTNKQTPTQIASEIMKGCKEEYSLDETDDKGNVIGDILLDCGVQHQGYCPSCKLKILAYRTAWENELEFLKNEKIVLNPDCDGCDINDKILNKRISKLTSALKILEGEQK